MINPFHYGDFVWVKLAGHAPEVACYGVDKNDRCGFFLILDNRCYQMGDFEEIYGLVVNQARYSVCEKIKQDPKNWAKLLTEDEQKFVKRTCGRCVVEGCPDRDRGRCFLRGLEQDKERINFEFDRTPLKVTWEKIVENWTWLMSGDGYHTYYWGPNRYRRVKANPSKMYGPWPEDLSKELKSKIMRAAKEVARRHPKCDDGYLMHLIRTRIAKYLDAEYGFESERAKKLKK